MRDIECLMRSALNILLNKYTASFNCELTRKNIKEELQRNFPMFIIACDEVLNTPKIIDNHELIFTMKCGSSSVKGIFY